MSKKLILIIGAPGSGKTTDGALVAKNHADHITSYSAGELLKDEIKKATKLGKINNDFISRGALVPTAITIDTICSAVRNAPTDIILLDGFPRKAKQMTILADILNGKSDVELVSVIEIKVSEAIAKKRALARGEDEELFNNEMKIYTDTIEEIESFYKGKDLLTVINGEQDVNVVVGEIDAFLATQVSL